MVSKETKKDLKTVHSRCNKQHSACCVRCGAPEDVLQGSKVTIRMASNGCDPRH